MLNEPPAAPEAEAVLLGCVLLLNAPEARLALADMSDDDFTVTAHLLTYQATASLLDRGDQPGALAVLSELRRGGRVSSWPTPSASVGVYLVELVEAVPIPLAYGPARIAVLEASARRRLHQAGVRLAQAAGEAPFDGLARLLSLEARAVQQAHLRLPMPAVVI